MEKKERQDGGKCKRIISFFHPYLLYLQVKYYNNELFEGERYKEAIQAYQVIKISSKLIESNSACDAYLSSLKSFVFTVTLAECV